MTPKQRQEHIENITKALSLGGWVVDRWGNYKKTSSTGKNYRVKMQKVSMRVERKMDGAGSVWINIVSDYYKNVTVDDKGITVKGKVIG